jgi:hypothetical protein
MMFLIQELLAGRSVDFCDFFSVSKCPKTDDINSRPSMPVITI